MGASKSISFEPAVLDKYATASYFINRGAFGNVYGPIPWHGSQLAIKQVMFADGNVTEEFKTDLEVRKVIWTSLEHKHLMKIHWVDFTRLPKVIFLVMEYAAGGSLCKTLRSLHPANKLPIDVVTDWAKQIAEGMLYLHKKDIVHRDLKSSNILLMDAFDMRDYQKKITLKITDFDEVKEHDHTPAMSFVGTFAYMAPEVFKDQWFSRASDVWSFGVVIWEMLSGDIPHNALEQSAIVYQSIKGRLDNLPLHQSFPGDYKILLNKCWESAYWKRISFHDIYSNLQLIVTLPEKYKSDPDFIGKIRSKYGKEWIC